MVIPSSTFVSPVCTPRAVKSEAGIPTTPCKHSGTKPDTETGHTITGAEQRAIDNYSKHISRPATLDEVINTDGGIEDHE